MAGGPHPTCSHAVRGRPRIQRSATRLPACRLIALGVAVEEERSFVVHVPMVRGRLTEILEAAERALGQTLQKRRDKKEISA